MTKATLGTRILTLYQEVSDQCVAYMTGVRNHFRSALYEIGAQWRQKSIFVSQFGDFCVLCRTEFWLLLLVALYLYNAQSALIILID